jgi:GH24 family phage-related lysozyme (muramidase)
MPIVPKTTPQVSPFSSNVSATPGSFGAKTAAGVGKLGEGMEVLAAAMRKDDQIKQMNQLEVEYMRRRRESMYANETGLANMQGQRYLDRMPGQMEELRGIRKEITDGIDDAWVRDQFDAYSAKMEEQGFSNIVKHSATHQRDAKLTSYKARMGAYADDAVLSGGDENFMDAAIAANEAAAVDIARVQGMDTDLTYVREIQENANDTTVSMVVQSLVAQEQSVKAGEVLDQYAVFMNPATVAKLKGDIASGATAEKARGAIDAVNDAAKANPDMTWPEEREMLREELDKAGADADDIKEAEILLRNERSMRIAEEKRQVDGAKSDLSTWLFENPGKGVRDARNANPDAWELISDDLQAQNELAKVSTAATEGVRFSDKDTGYFSQLMRMDDKAFSEINLDSPVVSLQLTPDQYNKAKAQQDKTVKKLRGELTDISDFTEAYRVADSHLGHLFRKGRAKRSDKDVAREQALHNGLDVWVREQKEAGKAYGIDEIKREAERLMGADPDASGWVPSNWTPEFLWSERGILADRGTVAEREQELRSNESVLEKAKEDDFTIDHIHPELRVLYENNLKKNGVPISDELLIQIYYADQVAKDKDRVMELISPNPKEAPGAGGLPLGVLGLTTVTGILNQRAIENPYKGVTIQLPPVKPEPVVAPGKPKPLLEGEMQLTRFFEAGRNKQGFSVIDNTVYKDSKGIPTIGIGFNLNRGDARATFERYGYDFDKIRSGKQKVSDDDAMEMFREDHTNASQEAATLVNDLGGLPDVARIVFTDMVFNMGHKKVSKFKGMRAALDAGDWAGAAGHLRWTNGKSGKNTDYWNDVGGRAKRHYRALLSLTAR